MSKSSCGCIGCLCLLLGIAIGGASAWFFFVKKAPDETIPLELKQLKEKAKSAIDAIPDSVSPASGAQTPQEPDKSNLKEHAPDRNDGKVVPPDPIRGDDREIQL